MIEFRNVSKVYNNGTEALHNINLTVEKGEFVFIVGSSGAGKSTFLKLVMCEERPNSGQIIVDGVDVSRLPKRKIPYIRRKMGIVFQDFRLIDHMTVYDNVAFAMRVVGASARSIRKRVPYILSLVGLQHKAKHYPTELSGGERQRVGLARALVNNPSMIIADEPTGNIDPALSFEIVDLLSEINRRGTTVLMVTHEHSLVKHFHKRIIQIHSGEIVADTAEMQDTYAPPERYDSPEEAVANDDDYAEYDNQETYDSQEAYQPAPQPAYQEEDLAYEDTSLYGVEGEESPEENAGVLAQQILLEQMSLHSIGYLFREGLKSLWKNRTMSIASIGVLIACLLMTGVAALLTLNISATMQSVEGNNVITVYLSSDVPALTAVRIGEEIRQIDNIAECTFVPKDTALSGVMQDIDGGGTLFDSFTGDNNPLPDSYEISLADLSIYDETVSQITAIEGVESVSNYSHVAETLSSLDRVVRYGSVGIVAVLAVVSLFIISNTVKVTIFSRRMEINIMKSVGATNGFVRVPFIVEGIVIGIISGLVSATILYYAYDSLVKVVINLAPFLTIVNIRPYVFILYGAYIIAGMFFGLLGGTISIGKYLKKQGENAIV